MAQDVINNDLYVGGNIACKTMSIPVSSVADAQVSSPSPPSAAVQAAKLQHQYEDVYRQVSTVTVAADQQVLHVVRGTTGVILDYKAGCVTPCTGNATITVDLLLNGSSILTSTISLSSSQAAYATVLAAGFTSNALAATNVLEVKVTTAVGTGVLGKGLFVLLSLREDPT